MIVYSACQKTFIGALSAQVLARLEPMAQTDSVLSLTSSALAGQFSLDLQDQRRTDVLLFHLLSDLGETLDLTSGVAIRLLHLVGNFLRDIRLLEFLQRLPCLHRGLVSENRVHSF